MGTTKTTPRIGLEPLTPRKRSMEHVRRFVGGQSAQTTLYHKLKQATHNQAGRRTEHANLATTSQSGAPQAELAESTRTFAARMHSDSGAPGATDFRFVVTQTSNTLYATTCGNYRHRVLYLASGRLEDAGVYSLRQPQHVHRSKKGNLLFYSKNVVVHANPSDAVGTVEATQTDRRGTTHMYNTGPVGSRPPRIK